MSIELIGEDRRLHRRYEFELSLHFHYVDKRGAVQFGSGTTVELSRGGIRFMTDDPPPIGTHVETRIAWPFKLQDICPLELVIRGAIASNGVRGTVLRTSTYEFRTCGEKSFFETPPQYGVGRTA